MCNYCYIKELKRTARVSDRKVVLITKISRVAGLGYQVAIVNRNYRGPKTFPPLTELLGYLHLTPGSTCSCADAVIL